MDQTIPHLGEIILVGLLVFIFGGSAWAFRDAKKGRKVVFVDILEVIIDILMLREVSRHS